MELNTLDLHMLLNLNKAGSFIYNILTSLDKNGIRVPQFNSWDFDLKRVFNSQNNEKIFITDFFKDKRFDYEVRTYLSSNINPYSKTHRWFELGILFKTSHLANSNEHDDSFLPGFEYSKKCKETILKLAKSLHKTFPSSYITFTNEYEDAAILEFIENYNGEEQPYSEFELAIVPKTDLGNQFTTNGQVVEYKKYRILTNKFF